MFVLQNMQIAYCRLKNRFFTKIVCLLSILQGKCEDTLLWEENSECSRIGRGSLKLDFRCLQATEYFYSVTVIVNLFDVQESTRFLHFDVGYTETRSTVCRVVGNLCSAGWVCLLGGWSAFYDHFENLEMVFSRPFLGLSLEMEAQNTMYYSFVSIIFYYKTIYFLSSNLSCNHSVQKITFTLKR